MNRRPKFVRRDVFTLRSDGIIEIEDSLGSEFGLKRVETPPSGMRFTVFRKHRTSSCLNWPLSAPAATTKSLLLMIRITRNRITLDGKR